MQKSGFFRTSKFGFGVGALHLLKGGGYFIELSLCLSGKNSNEGGSGVARTGAC
jgi:hypothetical protein